MRREQRIQLFVEEIWSWYARHKRTLPWRDLQIANDTERAYRILVSEIMLQQTHVPRVIVTYRNFLERFPTLNDLAEASNRDVIIAWRGMGYNSRALRLRDAAKTVRDQFKGNFPREMEELLSIKGIGKYTAAAVRNFAFNIPTPCIDTNIRRILHRTFVGPESAEGDWQKDDGYLLELAEEILSSAISYKRSKNVSKDFKVDGANWHAALMDFGSLVQTKRNPRWDICPLTAKGIMVTTPKKFSRSQYVTLSLSKDPKKEPGRFVGSVYIPNRIFRGRIVEALRDAHQGLSLIAIGKQISVDWDPKEHTEWLEGLLEKLIRDGMIVRRGKRFLLGE